MNDSPEAKKSFADTASLILSLIALLLSMYLIIGSFISIPSSSMPIGIIGLLVFFLSILGIVIGAKTLRYEGFSKAQARAAIIMGSLAIASLIVPVVFAFIVVVTPSFQ
jgi:hypothetical protein